MSCHRPLPAGLVVLLSLLVCSTGCIENSIKGASEPGDTGDSGEALVDTGDSQADSDPDSASPLVDSDSGIVETDDSGEDDCDETALGPFLAVTVASGVGLLATAASNGDGTFAPPVIVEPGFYERASTLLIGDFDGDGADDILARGETSSHLYLLRFDPCTSLWSVNDQGAIDVQLETAADLDGDGALDLVGISVDSREAAVWLGAGDGTFSPLPNALDLSAVYSGYIVKASGHALDVSGDGVPDILLADYDSPAQDDSRLWLALGAGDGTFAAPALLGLVPTAVNGLDLADLNLDGQPEVLAGLDDDGHAGVLYLGPGSSGGFDALLKLVDLNPSGGSGTNQPGAGRVLAADWDGDGAPDPIASYQEDPYAPSTNSLHMLTLLPDLSVASVRELNEVGLVATINFAVPLGE